MVSLDRDIYREVAKPTEKDFFRGVSDSAQPKKPQSFLPFVIGFVLGKASVRRVK